MAVTSIRRIGEGQSGSIQGPHQSTITLAYRVITDNPLDTPAEVRPALPYKWGDPLGATGLLCQGESYDFQGKGPNQSRWIVNLEFSSVSIDQEEQEREQKPNPLDRRARITVRSVRYGVLTDRDVNGNIMMTSAGETYEPIEKDATRWTIHVRKNYSSIPDFIWTYQDKLNDGDIAVKGRTLQQLTTKFGEVVIPELQIENGVEFYPIEFTLDYRDPGPDNRPWQSDRVDAGFYYIDGDDNYVAIVDEQDPPEQVVVAQLLDGAGGILRETLGRKPDPGEETYNEYDMYETADFSILPLNEF